MTTPQPDVSAPDGAASRRSWRQRLTAPLAAQLTQGVSPDDLARTVAVGAGCSMFPLLGTTSLLNFVVGVALRMNQPVLQTLNQLLGPLHLVMILVYLRLGEWLVGAAGEARFGLADIARAFDDLPFGEFLHRFGRAGLHAILAWAVTTPLLIIVVHRLARPALRRLAGRFRRGGGNSEVT